MVTGRSGSAYASFLWHDRAHDTLLLSVPEETVAGMAPGEAVKVERAQQEATLAFRSHGVAFVALSDTDRLHAHPAVMGIGGPSRLGDAPEVGAAVMAFTAAGSWQTTCDTAFVVDLDLPDTFIANLAGDGVVTADGQAVGLLLEPPGHGAVTGRLLAPAVARLRRLGWDLHLVPADKL